jgi:hypothetical protein
MNQLLDLIELALDLIFFLILVSPFLFLFWFLLHTDSYGSAALMVLLFWYAWRKSDKMPAASNLRWEDRSFNPRDDDE